MQLLQVMVQLLQVMVLVQVKEVEKELVMVIYVVYDEVLVMVQGLVMPRQMMEVLQILSVPKVDSKEQLQLLLALLMVMVVMEWECVKKTKKV